MTDTWPQLQAIQALGYSQEESRFLYLVAVHSGYFVARQFRGFTRSYPGQRTRAFSRKLRARRHAQFHRFAEAGLVYHLSSKILYRQAGLYHLPTCRGHEIDYVRSRIARLDFVLGNLANRYLGAEPDKVRYFSTELNIQASDLPAKSVPARHAPRPATRFFADGFPMFFPPSPAPRIVTFTYIQDAEASLDGFTRHLRAYLPLFRQLPEFHFLFLAATDLHFARARELFRDLVTTPLEPDSARDLLRYFAVRKAWNLAQYDSISEGDLIFHNASKERFRSARFEHFYRAWIAGRISSSEIREKLGPCDKPHLVHFEAQILQPIDGRSTPILKEEVMPIVKKAPAILAREIRLEEPVSELLDDYARFIESSADYVVNSVLKRILWRDQDYRKWRDERRAFKDDSTTESAGEEGK